MIIIQGRPASKKNSKQFFRNSRTGYPLIVPSKAFLNFEVDALRQLLRYREKYTGKVRIDYKFFQKGRMVQDVDNAMASINDVLQKAGIIDDDKNVKKGSFEVVNGHFEWITEIQIEPLEL